MRLLAIDPGNEQSAAVIYDTETRLPVWWAKQLNRDMLGTVWRREAHACAIEMVASYGMAVGATVFETCVWSGRFIQHWTSDRFEAEPRRVFRRDVKLHLCGSARAKDANVRQALIDRYGPSKEQAIGRKASPGPLYGLSGDGWAALAVAITAVETTALETVV